MALHCALGFLRMCLVFGASVFFSVICLCVFAVVSFVSVFSVLVSVYLSFIPISL